MRLRMDGAMAALSAAIVLAGMLQMALPAGPAWAQTWAQGIATALEARLDTEFDTPRGEVEQEEYLALRKVYEARAFAPIWIGDGDLTQAGRTLVDVLNKARNNGLEPDDYDVGGIAALRGSANDEGLAHLDYLLSRALIRYGSDLHSGRLNPREVDSELFVYPRYTDPHALLAEAVGSVDVTAYLAALAPDNREYRRLKNGLSAYRAIARDGGWDPLPEGETLKPGMNDPRVPLLRQRLIEIGDHAETDTRSDLFDEALEAAVKRFQYRHGLDQDGAVGRMTTAALNVPVEERVAQMLLNMERRRWMATDPGERYVFVNMADFILKVVDGPKTIHDTRVVVGKPYHRTPVFSGDMTYLVLNPFWNIPPSIARREILPKVKEDANYLTERSIRVFSSWGGSAEELDPSEIDWQALSPGGFGYKLRQDPGDDNALGQIKFMFPNEFNVYLHDTPARALFQRTVRSFSHGCVRVQYPVDLAEVLLRNDPDWPRSRIDAVLASGQRTIVRLKEPIPVHLTYLTAWINKDGTVHFRDDIYGRDKRLREALRLSRASVSQ